ncbi:hypothetical protein V5R04_08790 [Jonesiaceae bacterium BS-20]|uniref:Integral membrane protein n=1 Tax=Jonesiaceae bacterium BS-20 TaxID=3120821 RepID=A0AAU7DSN6_9MICO
MGNNEDAYTPANIVRYILDPGFYVLTVVACVLVVVGVNVAAGDTNGDQPLFFGLAVGAGVLPVAWMVLRTLWSGKPDSRLVLQSVTLASLMSACANMIVGVVMVLLPPTAQKIADARGPANDWHYYFTPDLGNPATNVLLSVGLMGFIAALLTGLLLVVFVVLPIMALTNADRLVAQNLLDTAPQHRKANVFSVRLTALLLALIFVMVTAIVVGKEFSQTQPFLMAMTQSWRVFMSPGTFWGEAVWTLGALLVPVVIVLLIVIRTKQRPDYAAREALGVNAIGDRLKTQTVNPKVSRNEHAPK